jgi:hypothetical protein
MTLRNRLLAPLSAIVVAGLIAALVAVVSGATSDGPARPPVLRLASAGIASTMSAEVAPAAAGTADARSSSSGAYRLTGDLPDDAPDSPVYALDGPYDTSRLARALDPKGLSHDKAAWWWAEPQPCAAPLGKPEVAPAPDPAMPPDAPVASDGSPASAPSSKEAPCAIGGSGSSGSSGSGSSTTVTSGVAVAPPPGKPDPEPTEPAMSEAQARAAAAPVFDAVDLPIADAQVTVSPWGASVWINPVVHGLPTSGYTTRVEVGRDREISYASGFLGEPTRGDTYPLLSADKAFDRLESSAVTDMMCRVDDTGKGCLPPEPQDVTGAVLGLSLQQTSKGEQLLVPAWLFTVKNWNEPMPQVAVEPAYLGPGDQDAAANPAASEPASTDPGSTQPVPPVAPKG